MDADERTRSPWWVGPGLTWRGTPLRTLVARLEVRGEPFPVRAALELGIAVLDALGDGHRVPPGDGGPVVHGRVSTGDVWLTPTGEVLVQPWIVRPGAPEGALEADDPELVAPERADGAPATPASDVHAAAALIVSLLAGYAPPLPGIGPDLLDPERVAEDRIAAVRERVGASLPARTLVALLRVSLAGRPEDRPDATTLAGALRDLVDLVPDEALPDFVWRMQRVAASEIPTVTQGVAVVARPPARAPTSSAAERARTVLVGSGAASLALCVVVLGGVLWRTWELPRAIPAPAAPALAAAFPSPVPPPSAGAVRSEARISVAGADRVELSCGDSTLTGTWSVSLAGLRPGRCAVRAEVGRQRYEGIVTVSRPPADLRCTVAGTALACEE